ncbi:MAG TPA: hypothetical protein VM053_11970 [Gemmatimonadaceae bacterium]|nr:hypothetical protein [Gemmatimonadaceae bacterium]
MMVLLLGYAATAAAQREPRTLTPATPRCDSVADTLLSVNQSVDGLEGRYRLVLVKTDSVRLPTGIFSGRLFLWPTSPKDSSRNGRKPHPTFDGYNHYFGTTNVDMDAAEAYAHNGPDFWHFESIPNRADIDPIRPPILGFVLKGVSNGGPWQMFWLAIGTLANSRDTGGGLDGMGIGLDVKRINSKGLFGTWGPFGIVKTGRGYFCAYHDAS